VIHRMTKPAGGAREDHSFPFDEAIRRVLKVKSDHPTAKKPAPKKAARAQDRTLERLVVRSATNAP